MLLSNNNLRRLFFTRVFEAIDKLLFNCLLDPRVDIFNMRHHNMSNIVSTIFGVNITRIDDIRNFFPVAPALKI